MFTYTSRVLGYSWPVCWLLLAFEICLCLVYSCVWWYCLTWKSLHICFETHNIDFIYDLLLFIGIYPNPIMTFSKSQWRILRLISAKCHWVQGFMWWLSDPIISLMILLFNILKDILGVLHISVSCQLPLILSAGWFYFPLGIILILMISTLKWCR